MESYAAFHRRSLDDPRGFWAEQAKLIAWHQAFEQVLDDSSAPINRWFVGGKTNL
ncbi:MAG: propionate--CoA ligase, partial [Betaproteobacteria bacterium]|nr:propionate--CoA ligase [Betaproteobacteria bacterium]